MNCYHPSLLSDELNGMGSIIVLTNGGRNVEVSLFEMKFDVAVAEDVKNDLSIGAVPLTGVLAVSTVGVLVAGVEICGGTSH